MSTNSSSRPLSFLSFFRNSERDRENPPFYAAKLWPKVHHTMGGLVTNLQAQVMDQDYQPIPGLYAAGEIAGGTHGAVRLGSCAITDCVVFGRIAGQEVAKGEAPA